MRSTRRSSWVWLVLALALVVFGTGCGGDDDTDVTSGEGGAPESTDENGAGDDEPIVVPPGPTATGPSPGPTSTTTGGATATTDRDPGADGGKSDAPPPSVRSEPGEPGIDGRVTLGPSCPAQRTDEPCQETYAESPTVRVVDTETGREVARVDGGPDGRFTVDLPPGTYRLEASAEGAVSCDPLTVQIQEGRRAQVTVNCDTGMR